MKLNVDSDSLTRLPERVEVLDGEPVPAWFGVFEDYAQRVERHDMDSIRRSIAAGLARERGY